MNHQIIMTVPGYVDQGKLSEDITALVVEGNLAPVVKPILDENGAPIQVALVWGDFAVVLSNETSRWLKKELDAYSRYLKRLTSSSAAD